MKRLFLLLLIMASFRGNAQHVSVIVLPVTGFNLELNSVTGFTVMNTAPENKVVNMVYSLRGEESIVLAEGRMDGVSLAPGPNAFSAAANNLTYSTINPSFQVDQFGAIPFGRYLLCVDVFDPVNLEPITSTCGEIEAILLSPPHLVYPHNGDEINVLNPALTWIPPAPASAAPFTYTIKVAEILPNQNPFDAVLNNFAVYEESNLSFTGILYPLTAQQLEYGKTYAWKVFAYTGTRLVGETEVWTFKPVQPDANVQKEKQAHAVILDPEKHKKIVTVYRTLKVQSDELLNLASLDFTIRDGQLNLVNRNSVTVKPEGQGIYTFTFSSPGSMDNKIYTLEVKTPKKKNIYATFLYKAEEQ